MLLFTVSHELHHGHPKAASSSPPAPSPAAGSPGRPRHGAPGSDKPRSPAAHRLLRPRSPAGEICSHSRRESRRRTFGLCTTCWQPALSGEVCGVWGFSSEVAAQAARGAGQPSPSTCTASVKSRNSDAHARPHWSREPAFLQQQLSSQLTSLRHKSLLTGAHHHEREKLFPLLTTPVNILTLVITRFALFPGALPMRVGNNSSSEARDHVTEHEHRSWVENKPLWSPQEPGDGGTDGAQPPRMPPARPSGRLLCREPIARLSPELQTHISEAPSHTDAHSSYLRMGTSRWAGRPGWGPGNLSSCPCHLRPEAWSTSFLRVPGVRRPCPSSPTVRDTPALCQCALR